MGGTLLHYASAVSVPEVVKVLLAIGFNPNAKGKHYGDSPLHAACCNSKLENAEMLLAHGATIDIDHSYTNPLFGAVNEDCIPIAALLIKHGIDVNIRYTLESGANVNAAEFAEMKGKFNFARFLNGIPMRS